MNRRDFIKIAGAGSVLPFIPFAHHSLGTKIVPETPQYFTTGFPTLDRHLELPIKQPFMMGVIGPCGGGKTAVIRTIREHNVKSTYYDEFYWSTPLINDLLIIWHGDAPKPISPHYFDHDDGSLARIRTLHSRLFSLLHYLQDNDCTVIFSYQTRRTPQLWGNHDISAPHCMDYSASVMLVVQNGQITVRKNRFSLPFNEPVHIKFQPMMSKECPGLTGFEGMKAVEV